MSMNADMSGDGTPSDWDAPWRAACRGTTLTGGHTVRDDASYYVNTYTMMLGAVHDVAQNLRGTDDFDMAALMYMVAERGCERRFRTLMSAAYDVDASAPEDIRAWRDYDEMARYAAGDWTMESLVADAVSLVASGEGLDADTWHGRVRTAFVRRCMTQGFAAASAVAWYGTFLDDGVTDALVRVHRDAWDDARDDTPDADDGPSM